MGIMDGAANGLRTRLENVGVRPALAFAIGQVAYLPPRKIPSWVAPASTSKSETTWLVSQYEKQLRVTPDGLASIALIQGLCNRVFGPHGEQMFIGSYPEFSEDNWEETVAQELGHSVYVDSIARSKRAAFTRDFIDSDIYWNGEEWVSSQTAGPGTSDGFSEALRTTMTASRAIAMLCRKYFDTPRNGLGRYLPEAAVDESREVDELSLVCHLMGPEGQSLEGFLVQSGDRFGFFDGADLMVEDLNEGSPILFGAESVTDIFCGMDASLLDAAEGWDRIIPVSMDGSLELAIQFEGGKSLRLQVKPENVLTDVYRSRYYCALYFLSEWDGRLSGAR